MAIYVNGYRLDTSKRFPDGTSAIKADDEMIFVVNRNTQKAVVRWNYESDDELIQLYYITQWLRAFGRNVIDLEMPYVPNARMDRLHSMHDIFTLKYFAKMINSMDFRHVYIFDVHSDVTPALINNVVYSPAEVRTYVHRALENIASDNIVLLYPDEGAAKRYGSVLMLPYVTGIKRRDWDTGRIESLDIATPDNDPNYLNGKDVLIVDDICSRGGTFMRASEAAMKAGASKVYIYCSHCEKTIFDGDLLKNENVAKVYTTDSIFNGMHPKMFVMQWNPRCLEHLVLEQR